MKEVKRLRERLFVLHSRRFSLERINALWGESPASEKEMAGLVREIQRAEDFLVQAKIKEEASHE